MAKLRVSNNVTQPLSAPILAVDTTITLTSIAGLPVLTDPGDWTILVLERDIDKHQEVIKVTDITGNVLTVERAQEGTVAESYSTGDLVHNFFTAGMFERFALDVDQVETWINEINEFRDIILNAAASANQIGMIQTWVGGNDIEENTPPDGTLECDGSAIDRTEYNELFLVIGTTYGIGDGSTTFNLPDLRGEFLRGWDHGRGKDPDAGARTDRGDTAGGDFMGTKQASAFASHNHKEDVHAHSAGASFIGSSILTDSAVTGTNHTTGDTGDSTETRPTNVNVMFVIRAFNPEGSGDGGGGGGGGLGSFQNVKIVTDPTYTLQNIDSGSMILFDNAVGTTVTVPAGLGIGFQCDFQQQNTGTTTFVPGAGATFKDAGTVATVEQYSLMSVQSSILNSYNFIGEAQGAPVIGNIESVDRTLTITSGMDAATQQGVIDSIGKYISPGVTVTLSWDPAVYALGANALLVQGFYGGGTIKFCGNGVVTIQGDGVSRDGGAHAVIRFANNNGASMDVDDIHFELVGTPGSVNACAAEVLTTTATWTNCEFTAQDTTSVVTSGINTQFNAISKLVDCICNVATSNVTNTSYGAVAASGANLISSNLAGSGENGFYAEFTASIAHAGTTYIASSQLEVENLGTILS